MEKIEILVKPVSYLCNLSCSYCFYKKTGLIYPDAKVMDLKTLEFSIKKFMEYSEGEKIYFCWQGGEPLIAGIDFYYNVIELQKKYGKSGQIVGNSIQTNGILIDKKWLNLFKNYKFFIGLSIDGPAEIHNFYRKYRSGKNSFEDVFGKFKILKENQIEFNILSTIGEETAKFPDEILKFFIKNDIGYLQFIPAIDKKGDKICKFSLKPETYEKFLKRIFDLWWNDGNPIFSIRFFDNLIEVLLGIEPSSCIFKKRCGEYLVLEHNGDIYPCDFFVMPEFKIGNVFLDEIDKIYERLRKFGELKEIQPDECKNCEWNFICNNGCLWFRYVKNGKLDGPDYFCDAYKKFFPYSIPLLKDLIRRKNLLFIKP